MKCAQFVGSACGHHGPYVFYKAVKIFKHGKFKILGLGEFFFVRISPSEDPCIGELQLLWEDKTNEQMLSSVRLYFLPEQTPEGRKSHHGEHEVVAASEKIILRLEDLRNWMTEEVSWCHGLMAPWSRQVRDAPQDGPLSAKAYALDQEHLDSIKDTKDLASSFLDRHNLDLDDVKRERDSSFEDGEPDLQRSVEVSVPKGQPGATSTCVLILSYARYCRYRSILKRLNGLQNVWLKNTLVVALGGFALPSSNGRVLFCRDTFDHDGLLQNDLNCEHLAPNLKGKPRVKKRLKVQVQVQGQPVRSQSPGSESNTSEDSKEISVKAQVTLYEANNGRKPMCKEEQDFLQRLFKFMQERHTPIHRVPHLGFKQIDLYFFFSCAQKLGGYDLITCKKMWKHVYDEMGGNPGSTSAATCTRRHYERLLLPFERYSNGEEDRPLPHTPPARLLKVVIKGSHETDISLERQDSAESCRTEDEDIKPDSPLEAEEGDYSPIGFSALPSQGDPDLMPLQPPPTPAVTPIVVDLEAEIRMEQPINYQMGGQKKRIRDTAISEKERKWNEIRRKTAMARNWARQLRPVKPGMTEQEQDYKMSDSIHMQMVSDHSKPPGNMYSMPFHPAYGNNKHPRNSSFPAMSSVKASLGHMPHRDYINSAAHLNYQQTQSNLQHNRSSFRNHLIISDDSSDSISNGFPPSKDGLYQRRPSVIQHTEKIRSPPLPKHPMPAHLGSQTAESTHLPPESANRVMFHPDYDDYDIRFCAMDRTVETNVKNEPLSNVPISRKPTTPMYAQVQQQRRPYYTSSCKDKVQAASPSLGGNMVRMVSPDLTSKQHSPSTFPPALAPSTPVYSRGAMRLQDGSPCEAEVLDLSVKTKKESAASQNRLYITLPEKEVSLNYSNEECLDLSVKKRKTVVIDLSDEARGIENVTPPSPVGSSPEDQDKALSLPPMKTPITSLSLLRSATFDKMQLPQRDVNNTTPPALIPIGDSKATYMLEEDVRKDSQSDEKPHYVSDYNPSLPPFMPPSTGYPVPTSAWAQNQQSSFDNLQTNLSAYKELMDHSVFSGQFPYALTHHLFPLLYKDGNSFPSFTK